MQHRCRCLQGRESLQVPRSTDLCSLRTEQESLERGGQRSGDSERSGQDRAGPRSQGGEGGTPGYGCRRVVVSAPTHPPRGLFPKRGLN